MVTNTKVKFPEAIQEALTKFSLAVEEVGFYDNPDDIPPSHKEHARVILWNLAGEEFLSKFISGSEDYLLTEDEVNKILVTTITQTCLDSLMDDQLIDGIENEHGELVYWLTEKGKNTYKKDC